MDSNSDGEDYQSRKPNKGVASGSGGGGGGGDGKPKRQMKTPFQLETLEKAYSVETYPTEATRIELAKKLGLADRQLQMWFCHRRLKDRREEKKEEKKVEKKEEKTPAKKPRKALPMPESPVEDVKAEVPDHGSNYGSGSGSGSSPCTDPRRMPVADVPMSRGYKEPPRQSAILVRAIACVEAQLGEPLREDGPILGIEFDTLPPDAFGAPIAAVVEEQKRYSYEEKIVQRREGKSKKASGRVVHEYQFLQDQSSIRPDTYRQVTQHSYHDTPADTSMRRTSTSVRGDERLPRVHGIQTPASRVRLLSAHEGKSHLLPSPQRDDDYLPQAHPFQNHRISGESTSHHMLAPENTSVFQDANVFHGESDFMTEKKPKIKNEEARLREAEAQESRTRKEIEKQDLLRRRNEERMRKEMERQDRERKKEEERLIRERQRDEEKSLREQKRELERREKMLQKEYLRAEKQKQRDEQRKEREEVRRKAAIEKATARRIAKESLDLIEDEQLELMELAAANKGLSSIVQLDYNTMQTLDAFRDSLCTFPSESIQLKKPFSFQPWVDSEDNVGNLLMIWRFCITFADVLGLWPFTLDEFIQALHDYDSRLLGEIHISLLKLIIKDIEDGGRAPTGLGTNQYSVANPEGGHPQIVEGAYMWGFDIRKWQQLLNPLSWPEILRELALSAGFGPQLRDKNAAWRHSNDEANRYQETVLNLRNGLAAENAFALMREKGLLNPRKSRHRLTPGTVKFAAFHVLSLEGSEGLTLIELADKIQKSGLRDFSTSRTPEASISVALTRDQKLFERVAPSTYCLRDPYRKDPADGEAILAEARKKMYVFANGFLEEEDADEVADDVERDDDSEVEADDDPEVDDLSTPLCADKIVGQANGVHTPFGNDNDDGKENDPMEIENDDAHIWSSLVVKSESENDLSRFPENGARDTSTPGTVDQFADRNALVGNAKEENVEIDETKSGESWVQGLAEGEYSHLSVEERLDALFKLVGIANEGSIIRSVLEDRLEAATALKKQMWAEAQSDRSHLRDDVIQILEVPSGNPSPSHQADDFKDASRNIIEEQKLLLTSENVQNGNFHDDRTAAVQDLQLGYSSKRFRSQLKAYTAHVAEETYIYRSLPLGQDRRRNRYWLFVASASHSDPCSGRIFVELQNGTWRVIDSEKEFDALLSSLDSRGIRESHLRLMLKKIEMSFKDTVRTSLQSSKSMEEEVSLRDSSPNCSAGTESPSSLVCGTNSNLHDVFSLFRIEIGRNEREKRGVLRRYQDLQMWIWKESLSPTASCAMKFGKKRSRQLLDACDSCLDSYASEDCHCIFCHQTFGGGNFDFGEHEAICSKRSKPDPTDACGSNPSLPLGINLLKALLASIEAFVPAEALESFWTESHRKSWSRRLAALSSIEELLQMLSAFESAIKPDFLSPNYESTKELLGITTLNEKSDLASVRVLPWIPRTMSAVALRLFELDASIIYVKQEKDMPSDDNLDTLVTKQHQAYSLVEQENFKEEVAVNPPSKSNVGKRRRVKSNLGRVSKKQRRRTPTHRPPSQTSSRKSQAANNQRQGIVAASRREVNIQEPSRGPRTVRKRRPESVNARGEQFIGHATERMPPPKGRFNEESYETRRMQVDKSEDSSSGSDSGSSSAESDEDAAALAEESDDNAAEEEDDNAAEEEGYEQPEAWNRGFDAGGKSNSNGWRENSVEGSDQEDQEGASSDAAASGDENRNGVEDEEMVEEEDSGNEEMSDGSGEEGEDDDKVARNSDDARDSDDSGEDDKVARNDDAGDSDDSGESDEYSSNE